MVSQYVTLHTQTTDLPGICCAAHGKSANMPKCLVLKAPVVLLTVSFKAIIELSILGLTFKGGSTSNRHNRKVNIVFHMEIRNTYYYLIWIYVMHIKIYKNHKTSSHCNNVFTTGLYSSTG